MTSSIRRKQTADEIWLHYFNNVLYKQGLISERERNRMSLKIEDRKPPSTFKRRNGNTAV